MKGLTGMFSSRCAKDLLHSQRDALSLTNFSSILFQSQTSESQKEKQQDDSVVNAAAVFQSY